MVRTNDWNGVATRRETLALILGSVAIVLVLLLFNGRLGRDALEDSRAIETRAVDDAIGATLEPVDAGTARALGVRQRGLVVTSISSAGPAAQAQLRAGDVIERVDDKSVGSPEDAARFFDHGQELAMLIVNRHGHYATVRLLMRPPAAGGDHSDPRG
jgi:membrane-associated protease RseP (regulator of RpoE activity)